MLKTNNCRSANGTGMVGYLKVPRREIVARFGNPSRVHGADDKVCYQWILVDDKDGLLITIYDYKESPEISRRDDFTRWHFGSRMADCREAIVALAEIFDADRVQVPGFMHSQLDRLL